ncbi:MAG TPA: hypothetical protein VE781_01015, partial [Kineosporiaceae bacterium]|nr:hypothetical protein [Kineosporiaceae bacterium]
RIADITAGEQAKNNNQTDCQQKTSTASASYVVDNTGPNVQAELSQKPNLAGWNNAAATGFPPTSSPNQVDIRWTATDPAGVASGPTPATDKQSANTNGTDHAASATDALGNVGTGKVTIKLDKVLPKVTSSTDPTKWYNAPVIVTFSCQDPPAPEGVGKESGINGAKTDCGPKTVSTPGGFASATVVDNADNSASLTLGPFKIDTVKPTLSGSPTTSPNAAGWYNGSVAVRWTCSDDSSGIDPAGSVPAPDATSTPCPRNSTISAEGTGLTATATVKDNASNTTTASSSPAVKIDKTAPNTTANAATAWNNTDVTVELNAADALSGVADTFFKIDGGAQQTYSVLTKPSFSTDGVHTLEFWSVDAAGNEEMNAAGTGHKTVQVKIDKTPPTIKHSQSPAPNANNWNNADVIVTFTCADAVSGIASCTADGLAGPTPDIVSKTVASQGKDQPVTGKATDNAGNSAIDPATVSIDKTPPTISGAPDRPANPQGWYKDDVTVTFSCDDALSGPDTCVAAGTTPPAPSKTLGEGRAQSVSGTATDAAGNTASTDVAGINVDKTAPTLSGTAGSADPAQPTAAGWYKGDVTVSWTCSDALSGIDPGASSPAPLATSVDGCPASTILTDEGDAVSAQASVADKAGNATTSTTTVKIDRHAPATSASVPPALETGWYAGPVTVTLIAVDALSGVAKTYYSVDGGLAQVYDAATKPSVGKGTHTVTFWSEDNAGNTEDKTVPGHSITLRVDDVPPTITGDAKTADGFAYTAGAWTNQDVNVTFKCSDAESGVASCVGSTTLSAETPDSGTTVTGNAQDNAGNTSETTFGPVKIDKTAPTLEGKPTAPANAFGWYRADVTIAWTGQDGLSGVDPASVPPNSTIIGEGLGLKAGPATVRDNAGNVSAPTSSAPVNIDRTAPTISGKAVNDDGTARSANAAGWYNSAVRVRFSCSDALSGLPADGCPEDVILDRDGTGQSASGQAIDKADNTATATVPGINIDSTRPQTELNNRCDSTTGFCKNGTVTLVVTARDLPPAGTTVTPSKAKSIAYNWSFNNGATWVNATDISGAVTDGTPVPLTLSTSASGTVLVKYYATDNAGNVEQANYAMIKFDNIAPTLTHVTTPKLNAAGWANANLNVQFTAIDDDLGSGVNQSTFKCGAPDATDTPVGGTVTPDPVNTQKFYCDAGWSAETSGQAINAQVDDIATNSSKDSETVKLDKTAPTISGAATTSPNAAGWYNAPVTVKFTCADQGTVQSGIATCTGVNGAVNNGVVLDANGAAQFVTGTAEDKADNRATTTVSGINIDTEKPTITLRGIANGGVYNLGAVPAASCTATDGFSGVDANGCKVSVTGGLANGVGTFNFTATATDKAG